MKKSDQRPGVLFTPRKIWLATVFLQRLSANRIGPANLIIDDLPHAASDFRTSTKLGAPVHKVLVCVVDIDRIDALSLR